MNTIMDLGEKNVIRTIIKCLDVMPCMPVQFGDDVSAVIHNNGKLAVMKTDMLVGKTDVPLGMSLRQAARKAVVMNISDFAAKGVKPLVVLVSLGLPMNLTEEDVKQIGLGLNDGAREYGAYIIGGDTNEASDLVISCSLFGFCDQHILVKRSGAKPGDLLAVTGHFGKTSAGLKILLEGISVPEDIKKPLLESVLMPQARLSEGLALAETGALTASMDSSDGLAWSLYELSDASDVGFRVNKIPIALEAIEFARTHKNISLELGLYGGEEYELVVTVKQDLWEKVREVAAKLRFPLTKIGEVTKQKKIELKMDSKILNVERKGWEHFRS